MNLTTIMENILPAEKATDELCDFFAIFADKTRMKIVTVLSMADLCVNDLCFVLRLKQSTVSHQLKTLKESKLVDCTRDGKRIVYFLSDDRIENFLNQAVTATEKR